MLFGIPRKRPNERMRMRYGAIYIQLFYYEDCDTKVSKNNILFLVPCHRVILKNGKLGGYKGGELAKQFLINLEKSNAQKLN